MMDTSNKASRVEFARIEVGVLGNCRAELHHIDELAADIAERGLLQNLLVWHKRMKREAHVLADGREVWDRYILIGGNRRHAAIAKLRLSDPTAYDTVSVTLLVGNEDDALFAQIAENLQREDLTPVDLANAVFKLRSRGHKQAEIAKRLSKSPSFVSRLLKFREGACEELLRAVASGEMTFDTALALCDLDESEQRRALERFRAKKTDEGGRAASADAREGAGRVTRRPTADLRAYASSLGAGPPEAELSTPAGIARAVLRWALGEGEWPGCLPSPSPPPKS